MRAMVMRWWVTTTKRVSVRPEMFEPRAVWLAQVEQPVESRKYSLIGGESRVGCITRQPWIDALIGVSEECRGVTQSSREACNVVEAVVKR